MTSGARLWCGIGLSALLFASVPLERAGAAPENQPRATSRLAVGDRAPLLYTDRIAGADPVAVEHLEGRVVVLDFWATWCGPCRSIMPVLDGLHRQHHGDGLTVLGITREAPRLVRSHLSTFPVGYTVAQDLGGTAERYRIRSIPTLVVIDRAGVVREVMVGMDGSRFSRLLGLVRGLLDEPAP